MKAYPPNSFQWHLRLPVCETRTGCREHPKVIGMSDLFELCSRLHCGADQLLDRFWLACKQIRGRA
jgi:hypothetical protein